MALRHSDLFINSLGRRVGFVDVEAALGDSFSLSDVEDFVVDGFEDTMVAMRR